MLKICEDRGVTEQRHLDDLTECMRLLSTTTPPKFDWNLDMYRDAWDKTQDQRSNERRAARDWGDVEGGAGGSGDDSSSDSDTTVKFAIGDFLLLREETAMPDKCSVLRVTRGERENEEGHKYVVGIQYRRVVRRGQSPATHDIFDHTWQKHVTRVSHTA